MDQFLGAKYTFDRDDYEKNRVMGTLGYLFFFLPLIACRDSRYGRFCANQGLLVWLVAIVVAIAFGVLEALLGWVFLVGWLIRLVHWVVNVAVLLSALYLAYRAWNGDVYELPFIGSTRIFR